VPRAAPDLADRYAGQVIVICGEFGGLGARPSMAASLALRAAGAIGRGAVEAVGLVPADAEGDRTLIALAKAGVGHAAMLRGPYRPLEAADVDLAIRYLSEVRVLIAVDLAAAPLRAIADGAGYAGATAIILVTPGLEATDSAQVAEELPPEALPPEELPPEALVLAAPARDLDGTFAGFVAAFAVRLDAGAPPADAWNATLGAMAVDSISPQPGLRGRGSAR
jgi:hypothetical protein